MLQLEVALGNVELACPSMLPGGGREREGEGGVWITPF